jgi:hypothetical protein
VVEYCDSLRVAYRISRRRVSPHPKTGRLRDRDLLPFPLDETVSANSICEQLDCSLQAVTHLIEEGKLVAYQVQVGLRGSPWRIHRPSAESYVASLRETATVKASLRRIASCL